MDNHLRPPVSPPSPPMLALLGFALVGFAGACGDAAESAPLPIKVMTYNLYLGSSLTRVLTAEGPAALPAAAAAVYAEVVASDFPERAKVLADLIVGAAPDIVGLQEVSLYRKQVPGDFAAGVTTPNATEPIIDFLAILIAELDARGGGYRAVHEAMNVDAELPVSVPDGESFDLRLTDRDVILAREGVEVSNPTTTPFANTLMFPLGGAGGHLVNFARSYSTVTATVAGATVTVANSHLEVGAAEPIQIEQAKELLAGLRPITTPLILLGDFNSPPVAGATNSFALLIKEFRDAYLQLRLQDAGVTCCQASDLKNAGSQADQRIDLVMYRGPFRALDGGVIGNDPATGRTPGGQWASDHFGVAVTLGLTP